MVQQPNLPLPDNVGAVAPGITVALGVIEPGPVSAPLSFDLGMTTLQGRIAAVQSIWIDNWSNDAGVLVTVPRTGQIVYAPPFSIGWYPIMVPPIITLSFVFFPSRATVTSAPVSVALASNAFSQGPIFNETARGGEPLTATQIIPASASITGVAGQVIRVWAMSLTTITAGVLNITDGTTTFCSLAMGASGAPFTLQKADRPYFVCAAGASFSVTGSNPRGFVLYSQGA